MTSFAEIRKIDPKSGPGLQSLSRTVEASYTQLVEKLGEHNIGLSGDDKTTTGWVVQYGRDVFRVYDFKETSEYLGEGEGPSIEELRSDRVSTWWIGGVRGTDPQRFIDFLTGVDSQRAPEPPTSDLAEVIAPQRELKRLDEYLQELDDPRRDKILAFHEANRREIEIAKGSKTKHQAWEGGYVDHLADIFRMAEVMYEGFSRMGRELPFSLASAYVVLYFHDVEKIWKYSTGLPEDFDKDQYLFETLAEEYDIEFSEEETNALTYIHGEPHDEYNPTTRIMGPLAALCHSADTMSARMLHDQGKGEG